METASIFDYTISELRRYFKSRKAAQVPDGFVHSISDDTSKPCFHVRRTEQTLSVDMFPLFRRFGGTTNATPVFGNPRHSWLCSRIDIQLLREKMFKLAFEFWHSPRNNVDYTLLSQGIVAELPRGGRELTAEETKALPDELAKTVEVYQEIDFNGLELRIVDPPAVAARQLYLR